MKIIDTTTGKVISKIITNRSMTLDEAIEIVGEFIEGAEVGEEDVQIGNEKMYYDDLELVGDDYTEE